MSLKIEKKNEGTKDTVFLTGRLDTATAPELDTFAEKELLNTQELVLDFTGLNIFHQRPACYSENAEIYECKRNYEIDSCE